MAISLLASLRPLIGIGVVVLIWWLAGTSGWLGRTVIASPQEVWRAAERAFSPNASSSEKFQVHAYYTVGRALRGWAISVICGLLLGLAIGKSRAVYLGSEPAIEFFRAIPPVLAFPLLLVAFNFGERAYIGTIVFGCLPVMALTVARGAMAVARDKLDILRAYDVNWGVRTLAVGMELLPTVFLGARLTFSIALIVAVVTEMVFTPRSGLAIGALARDSELNFDTPLFYSCVISIGLFGYLVNLAMRKIEERLGAAAEHTAD